VSRMHLIPNDINSDIGPWLDLIRTTNDSAIGSTGVLGDKLAPQRAKANTDPSALDAHQACLNERDEQCSETTTMSDEAPLILIIEDDPMAQEVMSRRLKAAGYRVIVEDDGSTGLRRAKLERPTLVISDLHMPMAPGELVILGLRMDPATTAIPILVVSADPGRLGPEHVVDGVLQKPVRASELLATVERLISANRTAKSD
jgi:two-component system, cell cycle response regulator DivK